jgi:hypothetical protein
MIRRSTISPMVIFVCRCIPHDSADVAQREAATDGAVASNKKTAEGGRLRSHEGACYVALHAVWFFRRYAMKPRPRKPRIIIAQVNRPRCRRRRGFLFSVPERNQHLRWHGQVQAQYSHMTFTGISSICVISLCWTAFVSPSSQTIVTPFQFVPTTLP